MASAIAATATLSARSRYHTTSDNA